MVLNMDAYMKLRMPDAFEISISIAFGIMGLCLLGIFLAAAHHGGHF